MKVTTYLACLPLPLPFGFDDDAVEATLSSGATLAVVSVIMLSERLRHSISVDVVYFNSMEITPFPSTRARRIVLFVIVQGNNIIKKLEQIPQVLQLPIVFFIKAV